jgi:tRNA A-37 threonylcarbamoyl transferase component Bud32
MTCPDEADLLPLTTGEPVAPPVREHVDDCADCRERVRRLRNEITNLRRVRREPPSTLFEPTPPPEPGTETSSDAASVTRGARGAAHVGKYYVAGLVDDAGATRVYRAVHPTLNKELIVKLGRGAVRTPAEQKALIEEGKRLAQLDHPRLVRVYDLDFQSNRPFLVLEYVPGPTLRQYAATSRPHPAQTAALLAPVARGLAAVHRRGLVHREIDPDHIRLDEANEPRLDFGLACLGRPAADGKGQSAAATPEQAHGETDCSGPRGDVFALGGVLYFLLTGKEPFADPDPAAARERLKRGEFDRAALRSAGVPKRLAAICLRALASDPAGRYADADALAKDLKRFVDRPRRLRAAAAWAIGALAVGTGAAVLYLLTS